MHSGALVTEAALGPPGSAAESRKSDGDRFLCTRNQARDQTRVSKEPAGLDFEPAGLDLEPAGLELKPVGLELEPAGLEFGPKLA